MAPVENRLILKLAQILKEQKDFDYAKQIYNMTLEFKPEDGQILNEINELNISHSHEQ